MARELLGRRRASVFSPPIRPALFHQSYADANALSRDWHGQGLSRQAFALIPKILEVEREVRSRSPDQIRETHPELCFCSMNGGDPLAYSKHSALGLLERRRLLKLEYGRQLDGQERRRRGLRGATLDDLYDSLAALAAARQLLRTEACRLPETPPLDRYGLPMEITFCNRRLGG